MHPTHEKYLKLHTNEIEKNVTMYSQYVALKSKSIHFDADICNLHIHIGGHHFDDAKTMDFDAQLQAYFNNDMLPIQEIFLNWHANDAEHSDMVLIPWSFQI